MYTLFRHKTAVKKTNYKTVLELVHFMPPPRQTDKQRHNVRLNFHASVRPSVRSLVCYQNNCKHNILNKKWHKWSVGQWHKKINFGVRWSEVRIRLAEIGCKNLFWQNISRIIRRILTKPDMHTIRYKRSVYHNNSNAQGRRSKVKVTRGRRQIWIEPWRRYHSWPSGPVGFPVLQPNFCYKNYILLLEV